MGQKKRFKLSAILLLGIVAIVALCESATAQPPLREGSSEFKPAFTNGEILVKFRKWVGQDSIKGMMDDLGMSIKSTSRFSRVRKIRVPAGGEEQWSRFMRNDPLVEYAEPNYIAWAFLTPNDLYYPYQWHLYNSEYGGINMEPAWDVSTGSGVIVAVLDTGVAYEDYRESRRKRYYQAPDLAETVFELGYDFVNDDSHANDDNGHGTHVTGTIAQSTNNDGLGVAGVAFNASIMPVKVLDNNGGGTYDDIADGIRFAADNGAQVINLSLGGPNPSAVLEDALAYAYSKGVTIVASAGNDGDGLNQPMYPAAYDAYVIAVGATRYDETRSYYSNYGGYIDLMAPGGDTNVDQNGDGYVDGVLQQTLNPNTRNTADIGYWFLQGTSMSAPHVTGVAALLIANGTTGPDQIRAVLETTAEDKGLSGKDDEFGWGIVDAYAALNSSASPPEPVHDVAITGIESPSTVIQGDNLSVNVHVSNLGDFEETFDVVLTDITGSEEIGFKTVTISAGATTDLAFTWDTSYATPGDHTLRAEALVEDNNADNDAASAVMSVREPSHDIAITGIDAPSSAIIDTNVAVTVNVANEGTYSESTIVTLTDTTANVDIASCQVDLLVKDPCQIDLLPDTTKVLTFDWYTTAPAGIDHNLEVVVSSVTGEIDTSDNSMPTTVSITQGSVISVQDITIVLSGRRGRLRGTAYVTLADGTEVPVSGAVVSGEWRLNGVYLNSSIANTNDSGVARLRSSRVGATSGDAFEFCVTNAVIDGYTYTTSGSSDCGTITVP